MPTAASVAEVGDSALLPAPSPVVLHDLRARAQGQDCNVDHWVGVEGQGSCEAFLLILVLPGRSSPAGKFGALGALETHPAGRQGPGAGGKKPKWQVEAWLSTSADSRLGPAANVHEGVKPVHPQGVLPELLSDPRMIQKP